MTQKPKRSLKRLLVPLKYDTKQIVKGDARIYKDSIFLNEGEYSDSITRAPVYYSSDELKKATEKWNKNKLINLDDDKVYLDLDHKVDEVLMRIGYATNIYFANNAIKGDLYLHRLTENSKDTVRLIDAGFINKLSVEITTMDYWDEENEKRCAGDIDLIGLAVVTMPADINTRIR